MKVRKVTEDTKHRWVYVTRGWKPGGSVRGMKNDSDEAAGLSGISS